MKYIFCSHLSSKKLDLFVIWATLELLESVNVITSYFRICSVRHYKAYWTIDFLQYNTWIFLFLFSNKVLDPIWKVYGLGFSKKSLDCENSWFSKTGILKFLLPLHPCFKPSIFIWDVLITTDLNQMKCCLTYLFLKQTARKQYFAPHPHHCTIQYESSFHQSDD